MITHGVIVPSHHTTVEVDIHSLCEFRTVTRDRVSMSQGLQDAGWFDEPSRTCSKVLLTFEGFWRKKTR